MKLGLLVFVLLHVLAIYATEQDTSGFYHIPSILERYQTPSGGFVLSGGETASLEATSHALFLASLFGLNKKIDAVQATRFVQSLENGDHGYAKKPGSASDLESVRFALFAYHHLGATVPNAANVATYVQSLFDTQSNLFAKSAGGKGDLRSTVYAFQALDRLNAQKGFLQKHTSAIASHLKNHQKDTKNFAFPEEKSLSAVSQNYFGVLLASYTGVELKANIPKIASWVVSQQQKDGGFGSIEATAHAVSTLHALTQASDDNVNFVSQLNVESLIHYVKTIPADLRSAASAHLSAVLAKSSTEFHTSVSYEVLESGGIVGDRIVQGSKLKPIVTVKSVAGVAHAGFDIEVSINGGKTAKLNYNQDSQQYVGEEYFDTTHQLGAVAFDFSVRFPIVEIGELSYAIQEKKQIGYGITVDSQANLAGKEIEEGETIGVGTELSFGVALNNQTHSNILSGDFDVVFSVLDSSYASIHTHPVKANGKPISFSYTLKGANIPAGQIICRFEVRNSKGTHTTKDVIYNLAIPMIATEITFNAKSYKIGDTVSISMVPASMPDLRTVHVYSNTDASGHDSTSSRSFFLDISSAGGIVLHSIAGQAKTEGGKTKYVFSTTVAATLDSIGSNIVSFRYVPHNKQDISLGNYDSSASEMYDDSKVAFSVSAELHLADVEEIPVAKDYFYGNEITFKFKVKDSTSGKTVVAGRGEHANVFLSLKHQQVGKSKSWTSTTQAATSFNDAQGKPQGFLIKWYINPNAVKGSGLLTLSAQDADGNTLALYEQSKKEEVQYKVNIGGEIKVKSDVYTTNSAAAETAFIVKFQLTCQDRILKDAQLRGIVSLAEDGSFEAFQVPVATSNKDGSYQVSFSAPSKQIPSGKYLLQFFREVDRSIARDSEDAVAPLFEITAEYQAPSTNVLPFRTEFLVVSLFAFAFFTVYSKKSKIGK